MNDDTEIKNDSPTPATFGSPSMLSHKPVWAQIMSDIFSPIMIPTYGMALAMWATPLRSISESSRLIATLLVAVITALIPLVTIAMLIKTGKISDAAISNRSQRTLPMTITAICYAGASLFVGSLGAPVWLRMFFMGAAVSAMLAMIITLKWKISAHTTAMGGLVGMILWFAVSGVADINIMIMFSVGILLAGAIATSRLLLMRHTLPQVIAGLALGLITCFTAMCIK